MSQVYGEPTTVLYARVPQSVRKALDNRRHRDRRTISALVSIILEDWLKEHGELPVAVTAGDGKGS